MRVRDKGFGPRLGLDPRRPSAEADFFIDDIAPGQNEDDVLVAVLAFAPKQLIFRVPNFDSYSPSTLFTRIYQIGVSNIRLISPKHAEATVTWGQSDFAPAPSAGGQNPNGSDGNEGDGPDPEEILGPEYRYSTQGGTRHITQSVRTKGSVLDDGGVGPNLRRVIGLSRDRVEGCDVITGDLSWSVSLRNCQATPRYWRRVTALTGTINKARFCGRSPGEILFAGATGEYKEGDGWNITWNFLERQNELAYLYGGSGDAFTLPKEGHDFVWYRYTDSEIAGFPVQIPNAMYIEQVYKWDQEATYNLNGEEFEAGTPVGGANNIGLGVLFRV